MNRISQEWEETIYRDLARGIYCPDEAEVEAFGPLPPEEHTEAEYTTLEAQELLSGLAIDLKNIFKQGETLNRFSPAYADLCPKMMDQLRLAACALTTLYVNGEDVNTAAVTILQLRRLASFHFRKCQAAARAALGRNETIWVRTSGLELQWAKLLLRLNQTEIRFSRPLPQPKAVSAAVVSKSGKLSETKSSAPADESFRTLPQAAPIHAATPFRVPRPASPSLSLPELNAAEFPRKISETNQAPEGSEGKNPVALPHSEELAEIPQTDKKEAMPQASESREALPSPVPTIELNTEDLRLLKEYAELQSFRESRGRTVSRDIRLSDLFIPCGSEASPPET